MLSKSFDPIRYFSLGSLILLGCMGCGGTSGTEVSGKITFLGKPVPAGRIYFNPDFTKQNDGPQGYTEILNGEFDTRKGGKKATAGPTIVAIWGYDAAKDPKTGLFGKPLFEDYKVPTDISKELCTRDFEVPDSAAVPPGQGSGRKP